MTELSEGAGKGPDPRPIDRKKWDDAPYWKNLKKRKEFDKKRKQKDQHEI